MRVIDVRSFDIPSDENDYDGLVAFANTIANAHEFEAVPIEVLNKIKDVLKGWNNFNSYESMCQIYDIVAESEK